MKDLSFFLFKNSLGAKMKKGIRNFCNGDGSTSTLNQHHSSCMITPSPPFLHDDDHHHSSEERPPTLEEMILQLELEEEIAKKAKLNEYYAVRGRMSCVNNSDILRSARNALNQYPRFSLDGKDAMYRSSFRNLNNINNSAGRKSVCCDYRIGERFYTSYFGSNSEIKTNLFLPPTLAGESVIWCKPGVVAKLMGLEAMPVPISKKDTKDVSSLIKRKNLRRRAERHERERKLDMDVSKCEGSNRRGRNSMPSSSKATGYRVMKPVTLEPENNGGGWPTRRFSLD